MNNEKTFQVVKESILEILPQLAEIEIRSEKRLKDLGANSVDRMEVVTLSMKNLGIKIPLMEFAQVKNIGDIVKVLSKHA